MPDQHSDRPSAGGSVATPRRDWFTTIGTWLATAIGGAVYATVLAVRKSAKKAKLPTAATAPAAPRLPPAAVRPLAQQAKRWREEDDPPGSNTPRPTPHTSGW